MNQYNLPPRLGELAEVELISVKLIKGISATEIGNIFILDETYITGR